MVEKTSTTIGKCRLQMKNQLSIFPGVELFPVIMFQLIIQFDVNSQFFIRRCWLS